MVDNSFKPAWWLPSSHLQTLWPALFKKRYQLDLVSEQVELNDGDFVDICWSKRESNKIVLVLHGLEGSLDSHYANGIVYQLEQAGYKPVFMYFRGCSGRMNRLPRAYHSGDTGDIAAVVEHINEKTGRYPYGVIGYSLGANALLKWLGETGEGNPVKRAAAVSVPFKLHDAGRRLEQGLSKLYRENLLVSLRKKYTKKFAQMSSPLNVDVNSLKSFWSYDDQVTAPLHGFSGAKEYYDQSSSLQYLKHIHVPTRIIHALDDPFMFRTTAPEDGQLSKAVDILLTQHGGHVGFVSGKTPFTAYSWSEKKIIEFMSVEK